jgi:hypothetical protein
MCLGLARGRGAGMVSNGKVKPSCRHVPSHGLLGACLHYAKQLSTLSDQTVAPKAEQHIRALISPMRCSFGVGRRRHAVEQQLR